jgi:hypothetical protein
MKERFYLDLLDNEEQQAELTHRSGISINQISNSYLPFSFVDRRIFSDDDDEEQYMILRATTGSNDTNAGTYSPFL